MLKLFLATLALLALFFTLHCDAKGSFEKSKRVVVKPSSGRMNYGTLHFGDGDGNFSPRFCLKL